MGKWIIVMVLNATFNNISVISWLSVFYWWRKPEYPEKIFRLVQDVGILRFYYSLQKYFGTVNFCRMSQDVGKLRCQIAKVPLYILRGPNRGWIDYRILYEVFSIILDNNEFQVTVDGRHRHPV